jgi:hypothetical protein
MNGFSPRSIVEYVDHESAERAIKGLGERMLFGRPVFIREVCREDFSEVASGCHPN